ncbi:succinate dehydrogenase, cytochrome b556 subunit [Parvularcula sp. LCG005]|uniref:succinate dehydrogenase, cytochrome b556 subunit n=1 Tax=Parvularcula sp. LCG005 TaxID=3078805 RepID=UPI0029425360|nr:succinate dehydrogenase, cytochrome b556 subunit [Parvularcula sp. LCG005]WOI54827.1 succinate dehydrogenase, cytochrome b556 subunit [Parvularcula sp. LCG005]
MPLSPHLQIWRWAVTMASSIAQRATGVALYAGYVLLVVWVAAAAIGDDAYNGVRAFLASPFGILILIGFTWAQMYHMCKGILHLIWDSGHAIEKGSAKIAAWTVFGLSALLTIIIWAVAFSVTGA